MRLKDKAVVITGATKGIGRGVALALAREGALVAAGGRSQSEGDALVREIQELYGQDAIYIQGDIKDEDYCRRIIDETTDRFGRLDGLVNNAGIYPPVPFFETDGELFDEVYAVNARGAFLCSKYAVMQMSRQGGGSIVHIGSTHAFGGASQYSAYGTSKGALFSLCSYIARNHAKDKIRSNWITVGWVMTEGEAERLRREGHDAAGLEEYAAGAIPLGRLQTNDDIAYGVIYLLSDESAAVTETDIKITGGFLPW